MCRTLCKHFALCVSSGTRHLSHVHKTHSLTVTEILPADMVAFPCVEPSYFLFPRGNQTSVHRRRNATCRICLPCRGSSLFAFTPLDNWASADCPPHMAAHSRRMLMRPDAHTVRRSASIASPRSRRAAHLH